MAKIINDNSTPDSPDWLFYCEGCGQHHGVWTTKPNIVDGKPHIWSYNGNPDRPTFQPSIHITRKKSGQKNKETICHSFVTDGRIRFLNDCRHPFKGKTVDLKDID